MLVSVRLTTGAYFMGKNTFKSFCIEYKTAKRLKTRLFEKSRQFQIQSRKWGACHGKAKRIGGRLRKAFSLPWDKEICNLYGRKNQGGDTYRKIYRQKIVKL